MGISEKYKSPLTQGKASGLRAADYLSSSFFKKAAIPAR